MKVWGVVLFAAAALAQYDDLGNKNNQGPDKGPRFCGTKSNQLKDNNNVTFKCKTRNGKSKHPNLTKRCKVKCVDKSMTKPCKKVFCNEKMGWMKRDKTGDLIPPGNLVCT